MYAKPFIFVLGLIESFGFSGLHIFIFTWNPTLKEVSKDFDSSYVFTILMMSLMTGGSSFSFVYSFFKQRSLSCAIVVNLLAMGGFFLIYTKSTYMMTLIGFILYEISVGLFYPSFSKIKSEYLPKDKRGTLTNIFKIPFNLIVIFLLINTNKIFTISQFNLLNLSISIIVFLMQLIFFNGAKSEEHKLEIENEINKIK